MIDHMTDYIIDSVIIKCYDITIAYFLDTSFNEHVNIWDYDFVDRGKNLLNTRRDWRGNCAYVN